MRNAGSLKLGFYPLLQFTSQGWRPPDSGFITGWRW